MKVGFVSLGCPKNQLDTEVMLHEVIAAGYEITPDETEADARVALTRYTKRGGQVWIKIFPDKPITEKPAETRMGSGKGSPEYWVAVVKPGRVLFEVKGVSEEIAREALRLASHKLPLKTKFLKREEKKVEAGGEAQ